MDDCKDMRTEVKAVVGTNAWGDALYGKMLRGSYVEEDVIREAVQTAIDEDIAMFDTARDYGLGKGQPMVGRLCGKNTLISAKYTPGTKYKAGQVRAFDAVASNYVYHNIPSKDRQAILLETLRTLKKGGTFAIHDIFSAGKYGDMQGFIKKLKEMGYEKVDLIDTTNGKWIRKGEAGWMGLSGSSLLTGRK